MSERVLWPSRSGLVNGPGSLHPWFWIVLYDPNWFDSADRGCPYPLHLRRCDLHSAWPWCRPFSVSLRTPQDAGRESVLKRNARWTDLQGALFRGIAIITLRNKPFQRICTATFFIFNAYNCVAGFAFFIIVYYMNGGDPVAAGVWPALFGSVSALCTCGAVIPIVTYMSQKYGKHRTFLITQTMSLAGYAMFWWSFSPENPYLMFLPIPLFVFGIGGLFTIMMSMTADICDLDELNTHERREGLFGAIYWLMVKFGAAFAGLLSGLILAAVGFDQTSPFKPMKHLQVSELHSLSFRSPAHWSASGPCGITTSTRRASARSAVSSTRVRTPANPQVKKKPAYAGFSDSLTTHFMTWSANTSRRAIAPVFLNKASDCSALRVRPSTDRSVPSAQCMRIEG